MQLTFNPRLAHQVVGESRPLTADDLDNVTVSSSDETTFYSKQCPNDKILWWGHGGKDRRSADTKFMFLDLKATGNGAGNDGNAINGEVFARVSDSDQRRVLASVSLGEVSELRDARTDDDRTERPVMYALAPYAKPGRHLELSIQSTSGTDGYEIDNTENPGTDSSARLWYSEMQD